MLPLLPPQRITFQGHPQQTPSLQAQISQQQTLSLPVVPSQGSPNTPVPSAASSPRRKYTRIVAIVLVVALAISIYFIWHPPTPKTAPSVITQQNFGSSTSPKGTNSADPATGQIQVYIVGAVKHPGVYTLPAGARVYQLLEAAGGPLPNANLVALNLAAKLSDGQEVYVVAIGETPPTYQGGVPGTGADGASTGQLVNINTATVDELRQKLHIGSTTAQNIVNYRTEHGPYTSVDQLLQVVSKAIYDKIKDQVTV